MRIETLATIAVATLLSAAGTAQAQVTVSPSQMEKSANKKDPVEADAAVAKDHAEVAKKNAQIARAAAKEPKAKAAADSAVAAADVAFRSAAAAERGAKSR